MKSLIAIAALAAASISLPAVHAGAPFPAAPRRAPRPPVQRMVTSSSQEIQDWNAKVEAKRIARKGARYGR